MHTSRRACRFLVACAASIELATPLTAFADEISFSDALRVARERNELILAADQERSEKQEQRTAAKSYYWPTVDLSARETKLDAPIVIDLNPIRSVILGLHANVPPQLIPSFDLRVQDEEAFRSAVTMRWPLYTGGKASAANGAAEAAVRDASEQRRAAEQVVTVELVRRYFGLRLAMRAMDVRRDVLAGLDRHVYQATRLEEEGLISHAERLNAEVARAEAERQLKATEHDVAISRTALASVLSSDEAPDPASPLFLITHDLDLGALQDEAIRANPSLLRLDALRDAAAEGVRAERGTLLPDVYAFGLYEITKDDLTVLDPEWAVGVGASLTVFDRNARIHRIAAARNRETKVDLLASRAKRDIGTLVEKQVRETEKAREQFATLDATLALAQESLRVRNRAFEEGMATSLEVVDAQLALARVELERLAAAYDFDVALAELLAATGAVERFDEMRMSAETEVK